MMVLVMVVIVVMHDRPRRLAMWSAMRIVVPATGLSQLSAASAQ